MIVEMIDSVYRVFYFLIKGLFRGYERDIIVDGRKIIILLVIIRFDNIFVIVGLSILRIFLK